MTGASTPPASPKTDLEWEEYKLLQEKLDKVGDFRFRIRSWIVTLMTAIIVTGVASNAPPIMLLFAIPVILAFYLLERQQNIWQQAFASRLLNIEEALRDRKSNPSRSPGIAAAVIVAAKKISVGGHILDRTSIRARKLFYGIMYTLVLLAFALKLTIPPKTSALPVKISDPIEIRINNQKGRSTNDQ